MLVSSDQHPEHFLVGQKVRVNDEEEGKIQCVIVHEVELHGIRTEKKRVIVDVGDREVNVGSENVEVVRR